MIDFHSHILPQLDDGSHSIAESLSMLSSLKNQGVCVVVATPHYKGECSIDEFLQKRVESYNKLRCAMEESGEQYPEILLGAEVAVENTVLDMSEISKLCIEGTNCLLVEMPNEHWISWLFDAMYTLSAKQRLRLIIAHVDRYYSLFPGKRSNNANIDKLIAMRYIFQINLPSLKSWRAKKLLKRLVEHNADVLFGSDCHNMDDRSPVVSGPVTYIEKKYGKNFLNNTIINKDKK